MQNIESEREITQCKEYLEDKLGEPISNKVFDDSCGNMKVFTISDIDLYHRLAQVFGITTLWKIRNIHYQIDLPTQSGWNIILSREKIKKFEETHGSKYEIIKASGQSISSKDTQEMLNSTYLKF